MARAQIIKIKFRWKLSQWIACHGCSRRIARRNAAVYRCHLEAPFSFAFPFEFRSRVTPRHACIDPLHPHPRSSTTFSSQSPDSIPAPRPIVISRVRAPRRCSCLASRRANPKRPGESPPSQAPKQYALINASTNTCVPRHRVTVRFQRVRK